MSSVAAAPRAPGRLGQAIPAGELLAFLDALRLWRDARRGELDGLDRAALAAAEPDAHTADLALAMALWQAVSDRYDEMVASWDSGRVGAVERERLSRLIWGRLATTGAAGPAGLSVSLVEALTLSDALAGRLRDRLALDPLAGVGERLGAVRAAVERCRDHAAAQAGAGDDAAGAEQFVGRLRRRVEELTERAGRGAEVTGPLGALEADVARAERDLIVTAARQRDFSRDRERAEQRVRDLEAREAPLRELAARCTRRIAGPPRLAVPDVSNLGPVPFTPGELDAYEARLDRVAAALAHAEAVYAAPLTELDELRGRLDGYRAMARALRREDDVTVHAAWRAAHEVLGSAPCDLAAAGAAVARYQQIVRAGGPHDRDDEEHDA